MNQERMPYSVKTSPVGKLGVIAMESCKDLGTKVDKWLVEGRKELCGGAPDTFLVKSRCPRFGNGEAKGIIDESVRGTDMFILVDVGNYNCTYNMMGIENHMSPDDHYADLKRIISAIEGRAKRINIIMPFLYGGRQHKRVVRESLDCAEALHELASLGVSNIITFDAHDARVQNSIPHMGFENAFANYQFVKGMIKNIPDLKFDKDHMIIVSPDEGGIHRNIFYSSLFGINLGVFYKRRDFSRLVNGRNPIVAHEYIGESVEGKDILIVDDMISSGDSIIETARDLKSRKAGRIFINVTYALFTEGIDRFNKAYEEGVFDKIFATNLTYRRPELAGCEWFVEVDMSKYIAKIIDCINYDESLGDLINPANRVISLMERFNRGEKI